jgi:hypothetical protein
MAMDKKLIIEKVREGWGLLEVSDLLCVEVGSLRNFMSLHKIKVREIRTQMLREKIENEGV